MNLRETDLVLYVKEANTSGTPANKRRHNFTGAEEEVLLQGVELRREVLFCGVNTGKKRRNSGLRVIFGGYLWWISVLWQLWAPQHRRIYIDRYAILCV